MAHVAIVDYGINNSPVGPQRRRLLRVRPAVISDDPAVIDDASHVILPGVGAFGDAMTNLRARGLDEVLERQVREKGKPFLAICLGMQLLARTSEEHAETAISRIAGSAGSTPTCVRISRTIPDLKIPAHGLERRQPRSATIRCSPASRQGNLAFYFVHSFAMHCNDQSDVVGRAQYGQSITAIVARDNIVATQFHPEKSQDSGIELTRQLSCAGIPDVNQC